MWGWASEQEKGCNLLDSCGQGTWDIVAVFVTRSNFGPGSRSNAHHIPRDSGDALVHTLLDQSDFYSTELSRP